MSEAWGNATRIIGKTIATTLKGVEQEVSSRAYRASNELRNASLYVLRGSRSGRAYKLPGTYGRPNKVTKKLWEHYTDKDGNQKSMGRGGQLYRASAPGEPPAVRTGAFRLSWGTHVHVEKNGVHFRAVSAIQSNLRVGKYLLGDILEDGTPRMAPRPYKQAIINKALPKIQELYKKPYKI